MDKIQISVNYEGMLTVNTNGHIKYLAKEKLNLVLDELSEDTKLYISSGLKKGENTHENGKYFSKRCS